MAKYSAKIERRALALSVPPVDGWVLLTRYESNHETGERKGDWCIARDMIFDRKKAALEYAKDAGWAMPFKAVRGSLSTTAK